MLTAEQILAAVSDDSSSARKRRARVGERYYEGKHDILDYRVFYIDKDGRLQEDKTKSNLRIPHAFFREIVDQEVSYVLSGGIRFQTTPPELADTLKSYFGDQFIGELQEILTDKIVDGFGYVYFYRDASGRTCFRHAEAVNIVEVKDGGPEDTRNDYIIRYYSVSSGGTQAKKRALRIEVWDQNRTWYYLKTGTTLTLDPNVKVNPLPHLLYESEGEYYYEEANCLPFVRIDNDRRGASGIHRIKDLIDDYDLMNCGLSNNLQDIAEGIYVVKGFKGTSLDELLWNVKSRRGIGVSEKGDLDIRTVNIPYEARRAKMEIDEKNIYRFSMAFNSAQSGDGNITNIVIRSRYTLLDMKAKKTIIRLKELMSKLIVIAIKEINDQNGSAYDINDVKVIIEPVVPTDEKEDAEIEKLKAEKRREEIGALLDAAALLDQETVIKEVCRILELDHDAVSEQLKADGELEEILQMLREGSQDDG